MALHTRRAVLHSGIGVCAALAGCSAVGTDSSQRRPMSVRYGDERIVDADSHERVQLTGPESAVGVGDSVEFTVTNAGESAVELGCGSSWTIQRKSDDSWEELLWTDSADFANCSNPLAPGESESIRVTLERDAIEDGIGGTVREPIRAGRYRFVLLGTEPFLAVRFRVE